ncbi:hypothetical protein Verru16b_01944 [Lacunisphaera limnophila]|uniref:Uncharacterized protein n=1 Tax=Lacunisphaera limnophila TaxID=1838286 RepID=A0A1D8AVJ5_9BACT|nr:hypothetical protein [Lacunisphaera limnophila]AOS44875.1 hypothetical protein Verru16b_01944 [Lacunisphaera limnophila]
MNRISATILTGLVLAFAGPVTGGAADETVATAVYANVGHGYQREKGKDGAFKPEYYALSNGGRIYGTTSDLTVDRVTYPQVAEIAARLLAQQNYHYAQSKEQAKLLLVLQWGSTIAFNRVNSDQAITLAGTAFADLQNALRAAGVEDANAIRGSGDISLNGQPNVDPQEAIARFEAAMIQIFADNRARDQFNEHNARVLGYMDDLADTNDIRRWAGGGDRFNDLLADVEESRYYIVISAYDFPELTKHNKKKLLWQTRVSVRSPGNAFDDSVAAMLKSASKYFGQDSGRLVRGEESKGTVELGDLKFLGEAKEAIETPTKEKK